MTSEGTTKTVHIEQDEAWPTYYVREDTRFGVAIEATPKQLERWARVTEEYEAVQNEIADLYEVAENVMREQAAREKAEREEREKRERLAENARRLAAAEERERGWRRLQEAGGYAYDADGNMIGVLKPGTSPVSPPVIVWPVEGE